ncbi:MAG: bifunctional phosphopantothenoylcysteine decarboxylase/phosphopantothenate--cysteine ligase CoaBC [Actinomycetota bacterium]|nr:bifunctional phosphopantothenoylcysteine decarboxylase/phosphopantothenate--cysteine ligase CoaBC [Actinomycetota bacterium]
MTSASLPLAGKHVVLGVSGGIAAYKSVELLRRLMDLGADVTPVLTRSALEFVGAPTFRALSGRDPLVDLFAAEEPIPHTRLGQGADLVLVAPATANLLAKFAAGIADDALTTTLVATGAPVVLAAAMHTEMWLHPSVVANVKTLRSRGFRVIDPERGRLAGGDIGYGRLAEPDAVIAAVLEEIADAGRGTPLRGRYVLVTAGGTREAIDPVRYIGNRSSGKQGVAVAQEAARLGATGALVTTVAAPEIAGFELVPVESALEMREAVMSRLERLDALVMCAAVADFRPAEIADQKIKRDGGVPEIKLVANPDILAEATAALRRERPDAVIVGFAAETVDALRHGGEKLARKGVDIMVVNDVTEAGAGFGTDTNSVWLIARDGSRSRIELAAKREVAAALLEKAVALQGEPRAEAPSN